MLRRPSPISSVLRKGQGWTIHGGKKSHEKLYNGTVFHRVIPDFMIQGGDPRGMAWAARVTSSKTRRADPSTLQGARQTGHGQCRSEHERHLNSSSPLPYTDWLTGKHTIFGEVVEGYDVVEKISKVKPAHRIARRRLWCSNPSPSNASRILSHERETVQRLPDGFFVYEIWLDTDHGA